MSDWLAYQLSRFISLSAFFLLPTLGTLLSKAEEPAAQFLPKKGGVGNPRTAYISRSETSTMSSHKELQPSRKKELI